MVGGNNGHTPGSEITSDWRRDHAGSGLTSGLILTYVEREAGGQAAKQVLAGAGLAHDEVQLRDENHWFSYETKLALWAAAEEVLGDHHVAQHVGEAALDLSVAAGLKRTLRALGSPGFVYGNVVRANAKFNWAHQLVVLDSASEHVRMRYTDLAGVGYHRYDCEYTTGLLAMVPQLFGLPLARVVQPVCGARGDSCCEFEVRWSTGTQDSGAPPSGSPSPAPYSRESVLRSTRSWPPSRPGSWRRGSSASPREP